MAKEPIIKLYSNLIDFQEYFQKYIDTLVKHEKDKNKDVDENYFFQEYPGTFDELNEEDINSCLKHWNKASKSINLISEVIKYSAMAEFILKNNPVHNGFNVIADFSENRRKSMEAHGLERIFGFLEYTDTEGLALPEGKLISLDNIKDFIIRVFNYIGSIEEMLVPIGCDKIKLSVSVRGLDMFSGLYKFKEGFKKYVKVPAIYHSYDGHPLKIAVATKTLDDYFRCFLVVNK